MLNRLAAEFAAEIANHDWSDAPFRLDRAGHHRDQDSNRGEEFLTDVQTDCIRTNVMWVTAQVLKHADPNLDLHEFAVACGVSRRHTHTKRGGQNGMIEAGIRMVGDHVYPPGGAMDD